MMQLMKKRRTKKNRVMTFLALMSVLPVTQEWQTSASQGNGS